MADVQPEHGTVRIAWTLFEAIVRAPITKRELKVFLAILRLTYGWRMKHDYIGSVQLANMTGLGAGHVRGALASLSRHNMLRFRGHGKGRRREVEPVKDFDLWEFPPAPKRDVQALSRGSNGGSKVAYCVPKRDDPRPKTGRLHRHSSIDIKKEASPLAVCNGGDRENTDAG